MESGENERNQMETNETKHTPGPWKYDVAGYGNIRREKHDGKKICDFTRCFTPEAFSRHEANARLIAAAPCILAALEDCVESLSRLPDVDGAYRVTCIEQARAAIAKAKGTK